MKRLFSILILAFALFLSAYDFQYKVPPLDATNNAVVRNDKGVMYMEMGQYAAAMTEFQIAISLSPDAASSAAYYNNLGILMMKLNRAQDAKNCFQHAIDRNPVFVEYYKNLISASAKGGSLDSDLQHYLGQIKQNKSNSHAYFMAGLIYAQKGQNKLAIINLKKFMSLEKTNFLSKAAAQMIRDLEEKK